MKIKVSEATGPVLDWMVAKALGGTIRTEHGLFLNQGDGYEYFTPSSSWEQGGPIIDCIKGANFKHWLESSLETACEFHIHNYEGDWIQFGPTPLIAAMRCYVASKLGDEVDVPEGLS